MTQFNAVFWGGVVLTLQLVACGASPTLELGGTQPDPSTLSEALDGAVSAPVYFGMTNEIAISETETVGEVHLLAGSDVNLELATADSSPLEVNIFSVATDGALSLVSPIIAESGFKLSSFTTASNGLFLFVFPPHAPTSVAVLMACAPGVTCTYASQPGQSCVGPTDCDTGLLCRRSTGVCSSLAELGVCVIPPASCTSGNDPVCGCDGQTYPAECTPLSAGIGIASNGPCGATLLAPP